MNCVCDFCSGKKSWGDGWCARCAEVQMTPPKHADNLDICDRCESDLETNRLAIALLGLACGYAKMRTRTPVRSAVVEMGLMNTAAAKVADDALLAAFKELGLEASVETVEDQKTIAKALELALASTKERF